MLIRLRAMGDPASIKGRARFGIPETNAYGVRIPQLRALAKELGKEAALAKALWKSGVHEARLLATLVMPPEELTRAQAERWLKDVASWDMCDGLCLNVVDRTPWAYEAARAWAASKDEWRKRAGFATMAGLASHDKGADDAAFVPFLATVERYGDDERNYVKKAVSWALRGMGKRSPGLRKRAVATARRMRSGGKGARWAAADALRELGA